MQEGETKPHLFDGWDDTPSYDGSQTNALKCFSDIFQQQIKIGKQQQANSVNKQTPKQKFSIQINGTNMEEDTQRIKRKEQIFVKKNNNDQESRVGKNIFASTLNRDNRPYRHHIIQSGIQDACVLEMNKDNLNSIISQTSNFQSCNAQDDENKQIFMKKNIFLERSRNQSLDQTNPFYNNNTTYQLGKKQNLNQTHQIQSTSSSEGRRKSNRKKEIDDQVIKNKFNASINLSILKTNYDDKSQYNFLNNSILDSIGSIKGDEQLQNRQASQGINGTALTQKSQQSDNDNLSSAIELNEQKNCTQQEKTSSLAGQNKILAKDNQQVLQSNNILIVTPEKFIPFHKQDFNSLDQQIKIKSQNISRNSQKLSQSQIPKIEDLREKSTNEQIIMNENCEENCINNNDLTNSFRQHQQNLQYYRNSIKSYIEDNTFYNDKKQENPSSSNHERNRNSILSRNQDQSRLSQRPSISHSKQKNDKQFTKSQSPSNRNSYRMNLDLSENAQRGKDFLDFIEEQKDKNGQQANQFSTVIQGKKYLTQNSLIERTDNSIHKSSLTKEEKQFTVQTQQKFKDSQNSITKRIENPPPKFNTEQGLYHEQITQTIKQNNELFPYSGIFNATTTQLNYHQKKNKSLEPNSNQISMGENIFYYYQQDKLPILRFKKKNQNDFLKLANNKITVSQKQETIQNQTDRSREKLNSSSIVGSSSKSSNYDQFHPLFRTPQQDRSNLEQRQGTAVEGKRFQPLRINNISTDKKNLPIKAINQFINTTQKFRKTNYINKNQTINQQNNQIVQSSGIFDNSSHIQSFLLTNYKRSPSMEQSDQIQFLNTESMYNNNQAQNLINNNYHNHHLQTEILSYNDNQTSNRKNKFRIFQHNYMYKTISPN